MSSIFNIPRLLRISSLNPKVAIQAALRLAAKTRDFLTAALRVPPKYQSLTSQVP
jgi:hypothetical protein